ncbi:MAG: TRAP transporter large permease subunit, partial [Candidatus Methanomethylophilaceae archaeon]|nr:TRAP transporter large permease subunit [Candidatus Methanomethylophilaceae archaeon]
VSALALIMVLPMAEAVCRLFGVGISGAQPMIQHITLIIAMVGGAIAARESRLLSISTLTAFLKEPVKVWSNLFAGAFAVMITCVLCVASYQFVMSERPMADILAYNIPKWWVQLVIPIGFGLITLRLWWRSGNNWMMRALSLVLSAALLWIFYKPFCEPSHLFWPFLILLLVATVLGAPLYVTLGGAAVMLFWSEGSTVDALPVDQYGLVTNPTLPTLPLFTLAGYFLAEGGASKRLIRVFTALVGSIRGGTVIMTFLVCAFFTTFTGASGVTILALGGLLLPVLLASKYSEKNSLGIVTSAGALGLLFPPSLPLILYAIIAGNVTIQQMFLGGLIPGIIMLAIMTTVGILQGPKRAQAQRQPFEFKEAFAALWDAKWELAIPVVAVGALFSGTFTPVEAASLTALYAFFVETVIYRDLKFVKTQPEKKNLPQTMGECGLLIGGVLLILGLALGFTNYLVFAEIPTLAVEWVSAHISSPWVFLLCLNLALFSVGCLMDVYSAIVVIVPLITPLGLAFGIDPIHLGIIFLANLEAGFLTPPVGMNLFLSSYRFGKPMVLIMKAVVPMLMATVFTVLLVTYIPWLTTWLPSLFNK